MIFEIADLDPKLKNCTDLVLKLQCALFYEIWHSEQIEHANYILIGIDGLDPKLQICEIWSQN